MIRAYSAPAVRLILAGAVLLILVSPLAAGGHPFFAGLSPLKLWWLIMVAGGVSLVAATIGTAWQWTGVIAASLLVGTSSQLGLTAPNWFQPVQVLLETKFHIALYLAIAAQMAAALLVLARHVVRPGTFSIMKSLGAVRTAFFIVLLLAFSVTAMPYIAEQNFIDYLSRLGVTAAFVLINIAAIVALAVSLPDRGLAAASDFFASNISFPGSAPRVRALDRHLPGAVAIWVLVVSSLLCVFAFERTPHLGDELAYVLQARYFSHGQLSAQIPNISLVPAFDYLNFDVVGDKWFSTFPPGWPLVLTLGVFVNLEWLVNPFLAAACILLANAFFCRESDRGTANVVILLMAVSPWFLAMSASFMSHTLTLALWLASCLLLSRARAASSTMLAISSGGLMGLLFLTRPLDGLVIGTLTGLWSLRVLADRKGWTMVVGYGLGCLLIGALVFPYNSHLTGDPFVTPIDTFFQGRWNSDGNRLGFGADVGPPSRWGAIDVYHGHSIGEAAINAQQNTYALNFELFGWGIGSLSIFLFHMVWGRWTRNDVYMLAVIAATLGAYSLYWFSGSFYIGPRYWFMTFLPLVAITASGIGTLSWKLRSAANATLSTQRLCFVLATLGAVAVVSFVTWRGATRYHEYRQFHADYRALLEDNDLGASLIFIRDPSAAEIGSASFYNPTRLDSAEPIFVRDLGPESNRAVAEAFPGRAIYFAVGRSREGAKARIVEGPIPKESLP